MSNEKKKDMAKSIGPKSITITIVSFILIGALYFLTVSSGDSIDVFKTASSNSTTAASTTIKTTNVSKGN